MWYGTPMSTLLDLTNHLNETFDFFGPPGWFVSSTAPEPAEDEEDEDEEDDLDDEDEEDEDNDDEDLDDGEAEEDEDLDDDEEDEDDQSPTATSLVFSVDCRTFGRRQQDFNGKRTAK